MKIWFLFFLIVTAAVTVADFDFTQMLKVEGEKYRARISVLKKEGDDLQKRLDKIKKNARQRAEYEKKKAETAADPKKSPSNPINRVGLDYGFSKDEPEKIKKLIQENKTKLREAAEYLPGIGYWPEFSNTEPRKVNTYSNFNSGYSEMIPNVQFWVGNIAKLSECEIVQPAKECNSGMLGKEYVMAKLSDGPRNFLISSDLIAIDIPVSKVRIGQKYKFSNLFVLKKAQQVVTPKESRDGQNYHDRIGFFTPICVYVFTPIKLWACNAEKPEGMVQASFKQVIATDLIEVEYKGKSYRIKLPIDPAYDISIIKIAMNKIFENRRVWVSLSANPDGTENVSELWTDDFNFCDYICGIGLAKRKQNMPSSNKTTESIDLLE